jgi:hypothetical protein
VCFWRKVALSHKPLENPAPDQSILLNPAVPLLTIPKGGIVTTESYSPFSQRIWISPEIIPGQLWLNMEHFTQEFERIG